MNKVLRSIRKKTSPRGKNPSEDGKKTVYLKTCFNYNGRVQASEIILRVWCHFKNQMALKLKNYVAHFPYRGRIARATEGPFSWLGLCVKRSFLRLSNSALDFC